MAEPKFKKGDKVVMHTCYEAEAYNGKIWECMIDSGNTSHGTQSVFLKGFRGSFECEYLQLVNLSYIETTLQMTLGAATKFINKVKSGRARSKETFQDMIVLSERILKCFK